MRYVDWYNSARRRGESTDAVEYGRHLGREMKTMTEMTGKDDDADANVDVVTITKPSDIIEHKRYQTADGEWFDTRKDAEEHLKLIEDFQVVERWLDDTAGHGDEVLHPRERSKRRNIVRDFLRWSRERSS